MFLTINALLFWVSLCGIFLVFVLYPALVLVISLCTGKNQVAQSAENIFVSLIVVVHNGEAIIKDKIENCLSLNFPLNKLEILFFSDGSTDKTNEIIQSYEGYGIKFLGSAYHYGKIAGLNEAVKGCSGDVIVFSDADALLDRNALNRIVRHYADPEVGGVCGRMVIFKGGSWADSAQKSYARLDTALRSLESKIGSITANSGGLYSVRRKLFKPILSGVTDDLYVCLSVIQQKYRFIFEAEAKAFIRAPSRTPSHEIQRRRRIVTQSLRGIFSVKDIMNPFHYGFYSVGLVINKVLRRLVPVFLLLVFLSTFLLAFEKPLMRGFVFAQLLFYGLGLSRLSVKKMRRSPSKPKLLERIADVFSYFCIGNYGTLLGLISFLSRKKIEKWEPV